MAATLANGGVCPITGDEVGMAIILFKFLPLALEYYWQVYSRAAVRDTLTLMHTCGMYDLSGEFSYSVCHYHPGICQRPCHNITVGWSASKIWRLGRHSARNTRYHGSLSVWSVD